MPLSGPAGRKPYSRRSRSSAAAYSTSGSDGSMTTSVKPVYLLMDLVFVQVLPPSVVLNKPRSPPGAHSGPSAATYTTFGSRGSMTMRPMCCECGSIAFDHVTPPSIDLYTPVPHDELR